MHFRLTAAAAALLAASAAQAQVTVTTGAGYVPMVKELVQVYEAQGGAKVNTAFGGNIGQMLAQVREGSSVNVVISDAASLRRFAADLGPKDRAADLGGTPLVIVWRKGLTLSSPEGLAGKEFRSVAMPDPRAAVYGRAAKEYLDGSGLGKKLGERLQVASTVPQVTSYVARGEMDAGFVNLLAARGSAKKTGGFLEVKGGFEPIRMTAFPVREVAAGDAQDVADFLAFLASDKAAPVLEKHGVSRR